MIEILSDLLLFISGLAIMILTKLLQDSEKRVKELENIF